MCQIGNQGFISLTQILCASVYGRYSKSENIKAVSVCYLLVSSMQLHMLELPEGTHSPHLLQVAVEGQSAQTEAVAAVADLFQSLHLLDNGGHGNRWWYC